MSETVIAAPIVTEVVECYAVLLPDGTLARVQHTNPERTKWPAVNLKDDSRERMETEDPRAILVRVRCTVEVVEAVP